MNQVLVVIDYQKDFVDGTLGFPKAKQLEEGIHSRVVQAKHDGTHIFFTLDTHDGQYDSTREGRHLPIAHCIKGSDGAAPYGKLSDFLQDSRIEFVEKNNFGSDRLAQVINDACGVPDEIELCGVVTNMCVISNAILLHTAFPDTEIRINARLCASFDDQLHQKALDIMEGLHMSII